MIKQIHLLKRKAGITPQQFRELYETGHVPLALKYGGHLLLEYRRLYPTFASLAPTSAAAGMQPKPYDFGYDAITEITFKDEAAVEELGRIFKEHEELAAHIELFVDEKASVLIVCDMVGSDLAIYDAA